MTYNAAVLTINKILLKDRINESMTKTEFYHQKKYINTLNLIIIIIVRDF